MYGQTTQSGFDRWRARVDAIILAKLGIGIDDLPDCPLMDWYEDEYTPLQAARKAVRYADGADDD